MPRLSKLAHTSRCNPDSVFIVFNFLRCSNDHLKSSVDEIAFNHCELKQVASSFLF